MIKDLEEAIGYHFQNISLLQNALAHSSYANERWHNSLLSNERLEFLGDSILGMLVAEYLYRSFPDRPEGELTRMRADMVCEKTLAKVANEIHLGEHLLLGHGEEQGEAGPGTLSWPMPWSLSSPPASWTEAFRPRRNSFRPLSW